MKSRIPCPRSTKNYSIQKITIINSNNISINQPPVPKPKPKNKSVDQIKKKYRSPSKRTQQPMKMQVKLFDLNQEMQKCRERELLIIKGNIALFKYYNCLITLFMVAYTSSQVMVSNFFQVRRKSCFFPQVPNQFGINFIGLLLKVYEVAKNYQYETKLRRLAKNLLKISPTASDFQKKIEFISRKVVLNNEKSKEIEMSFMNPELESFWDRLMNKVFISNQIDFLQDMFELDPQKLCVKNFQQLIERYLCCEQFEEDLKEHSGFKENGLRDMNTSHSFDIQFLLIQKLCTEDYDQATPEPIPKEKAKRFNCQIY